MYQLAVTTLTFLAAFGVSLNANSKTPTVAAAPTPLIEVFFYLNSDSDLLSINDKNLPVSQGEVVLKNILEHTATAPKTVATHVYLDNNDTLEGNKIKGSVLVRRLGNENIVNKGMEETNSADVAQIQNLLDGAISKSSVKILILWGHGDGWKPVLNADFSERNSTFDYLTLPTLLQVKLDLVIFDACQMGELEVLKAYQDIAPFVIASQRPLDVDGIVYKGFYKVASEYAAEQNLARDDLIRSLYKSIKIETVTSQKSKGIFAPPVLYNLSKLDILIKELANFLPSALNSKYLSLITERSQQYEQETSVEQLRVSDIRAVAHHTNKLVGTDPTKLVEAIVSLVNGYGSVSLTLPLLKKGEALNKKSELVRHGINKAWSVSLPNWQWIKDQK